jgi:1-acyl-sn-glycerol-3-phosphate acyltransferase
MTKLRFGVFMAALAPLLIVGGSFRYLALRRQWRFGAGVTSVFHRLLCAALGIRVRVHGDRPNALPALIAANHVSWLDIPALGSLLPVAFLAKKEVGAHWLARELVKLQGVVFVDRQRRRCIPAVNREIARKIAAGAPLALFAEATTGDGNRLLRFRSSHFEALRETLDGGGDIALVQPVHISYVRRNGLPLGRTGQPLVAWYGDMTLIAHLWRFLRDGPFDCEIAFGEPIRFFGMSNRKEIALQAQRSVRELAASQRRNRFQAGSAPGAAQPLAGKALEAREIVC